MKELTERVPGAGGTTIWLDLDGTLMKHSLAWKQEGFADPHERALPLLKKLKVLGYRIVLFTSRTDRVCLNRTKKQIQKNIDDIKMWLRVNGLSLFVDDVWEGPKPLGIIIDDRVVQFNGDEDEVIRQVKILTSRWIGAEETLGEDATLGRLGFFKRLGRACRAARRVWWYQLNMTGGQDGE